MIRHVFFVLLVTVTASAASVSSNAGSALAAFEAVVAHSDAENAAIVEVKGVRGKPLPPEWVILQADPSARGGVREVTAANGVITSERTPLKGFTQVASMSPLERSKITVDAYGVLQIAQQEAMSNRVVFDWIDYLLRIDPQTSSPIWTVSLYDNSGSLVGTMGIAAQGGAVVHPLRVVATEQMSASAPRKKPGGLIGKVLDFTETTAKKVQDSTLRTVGNVQEFLVGERTVGPKDDE